MSSHKPSLEIQSGLILKKNIMHTLIFILWFLSAICWIITTYRPHWFRLFHGGIRQYRLMMVSLFFTVFFCILLWIV